MITDRVTDITDLADRLPDESQVGKTASWRIVSGDFFLELNATFLGVSTSYVDRHNHPTSRPARQDERCRACRWFEPRIFRELGGQRRYLVHRTGKSNVPGEVSYTSHVWVFGAHEVIEVLTTRRNGQHSLPYLTHPAARVLAQAASYDSDLSDAYVNRAVA